MPEPERLADTERQEALVRLARQFARVGIDPSVWQGEDDWHDCDCGPVGGGWPHPASAHNDGEVSE